MRLTLYTGSMKYCKWCGRDCDSLLRSGRYNELHCGKCPVDLDIEDVIEAAEFDSKVSELLALCKYDTPPGMTPITAAVWRRINGELVMHAHASRLKAARINAEMEDYVESGER